MVVNDNTLEPALATSALKAARAAYGGESGTQPLEH